MHVVSRLPHVALAATVALAAGGCGSDSPSAPSTPTATISVTASGVNPASVTIPAGSTVTFVNQDAVSHDVASGPHPAHTDCPEINQVRSLAPGQSKVTAAFATARTCRFHDHGQPSNESLKGAIVVQ